MRYSSAAVLSTLAVGQAAAANLRHASFHARRQAEVKRGAADVKWDAVAYDLSKVDWSTINWSSVFASPTPTPSAAPSSAAKKQEAVATSEAAPSSTEAAYTPASSKVEEETPKATATETSNPISDAIEGVTDFLKGVSSCISKLGVSKVGVNAVSPNGGIWIGESDWDANFVNKASEDLVLFCWESAGFTGMTINVNQPAISVGIPAGENVTISFAPGVGTACAQAFGDTVLADFGGLKQTWIEQTLGQNGAFDVSRNVYMNGNSISAVGSKCTSDMNTCVFKCTGDVESCEKGYDLFNCGAGSGGGGGYDPVMQGTGGGCAIGESSEHITVTFS